MEEHPEINELDFMQENIWQDFGKLLEDEKKEKAVFLNESSSLKKMNLEQFVNSDPELLMSLLADENNEVVEIERLKMLGYWVAYKEIKQEEGNFALKGDAGSKFVEIQKQIDGVALSWLNHEISTNSESGETASWAQKQLQLLNFDLEKRQGKKYTNLQILRGSKCNVGCVFCFTQKAETENVDTKGHLIDVAEVNYDKGDVALQMLYSRMAYGLDEILFTSYGDPLANERKDLNKEEVNPLVSLNDEIKMAKEVGFPQITILSNCTGLQEKDISRLSNEERKRLGVESTDGELSADEVDRLGKIRIDMLVDSGLTHLTISLHTMNPDTWRKLVNPRNGVSYEQMVEWVRYAGNKEGLVARVNVAYGTEVESAEELIPWARNTLGAQELTLVEMIPGNKYAIEHKRVPPDDAEMKRMDFEAVGGQPWGLRIYKQMETNFSVAVCHFGQQDPSFADQGKNLELILAGGRGTKGSMLIAGGLWDQKALEWWKI